MAENNIIDTNNHFCRYCEIDPHAHSFHVDKVARPLSNTFRVYTTVCEATLYNKPDTIIHHIENDTNINRELTWEWTINFIGAGLKHYMAINTVVELSKWINREKDNKCKNLLKIYIIGENNAILYPLVLLSKFFLPSHIDVINERVYRN